MTEPTLIDILLTNLKHHPWHLYPDYKIDEATGKALIELLEKVERVEKQCPINY